MEQLRSEGIKLNGELEAAKRKLAVELEANEAVGFYLSFATWLLFLISCLMFLGPENRSSNEEGKVFAE